MSLFTNEEVCFDCKHAIFHDCCGKFCKCLVDGKISGITGDCEKKESKIEEQLGLDEKE